MGGLLVQFLGLFGLLGLAAWGYRHWISPRQIGIQGKWMLLLSVVILVGGLLGSTGWWIDDPRSHSGEVEYLHDLPTLLGDVRQELILRPVLADYPACLARAPDRDRLPAVRKEAGPRREPGDPGRRSSLGCNEFDGFQDGRGGSI